MQYNMIGAESTIHCKILAIRATFWLEFHKPFFSGNMACAPKNKMQNSTRG